MSTRTTSRMVTTYELVYCFDQRCRQPFALRARVRGEQLQVPVRLLEALAEGLRGGGAVEGEELPERTSVRFDQTQDKLGVPSTSTRS